MNIGFQAIQEKEITTESKLNCTQGTSVGYELQTYRQKEQGINIYIYKQISYIGSTSTL